MSNFTTMKINYCLGVYLGGLLLCIYFLVQCMSLLPAQPLSIRGQNQFASASPDEHFSQVATVKSDRLSQTSEPLLTSIGGRKLRARRTPLSDIPIVATSVGDYNSFEELWSEKVPPEVEIWPDHCDLKPTRAADDPPTVISGWSVLSPHANFEYRLVKLGWKFASPIEGLRYIPKLRKIIKCHPHMSGAEKLYCSPRNTSVLINLSPLDWSVDTNPGYDFGVNIHCRDQRINSLPQSGQMLSNKANMYLTISEFYQDLVSRGKQHCFPEWEFIPTTYNLRQGEQCRDFFDNVYKRIIKDPNAERYYIKDGNIHAGAGVHILTPDLESESWLKYGLGSNCGHSDLPDLIAQREKTNLYLIDGRKSDIRIYSMVLSIKPLYVVMSPDFFFRRTIGKLDVSSNQLKDVLTQYVGNSGDQDVINEAYVTKEEWLSHLEKEYEGAGFARIKLNETEKKMQNLATKLFMIVYKKMPKYVNAGDVFHLLGWDFMLDRDLNPSWLETNGRPNTNRGYFETAVRQQTYMASFVNRMVRGQKASELDLRTFDGKKFTPLIDFSQENDFDKFFENIGEECISEFML